MKYMQNFLCFKPLATGVMMFTGIFLTLSILILLVNSNALMNSQNPPIFLLAIVSGLAVTWMIAFVGEFRDSKRIIWLALLVWTIVILFWLGLVVLTIALKKKMACTSNGSKCPPTLWLYSSGGDGDNSIDTTTEKGEVTTASGVGPNDTPKDKPPAQGDSPAATKKPAKPNEDENKPVNPTTKTPEKPNEDENKPVSPNEPQSLSLTLPMANYDYKILKEHSPINNFNFRPMMGRDYHDFDEGAGEGRKKAGKKKKEKDSGDGEGGGSSGADNIIKILPLMIFFLVLMTYAWFTLLSYYAELKSIASCTCNGSCCRQCRI